MKHIAYSSVFTTEADAITILDLDDHSYDPDTFESHMHAADMYARLESAANQWSADHGFASLDELLAQDEQLFSRKQASTIQSVVGDDENTCTDSQSLGPLLITAGPVISGIKLSLKDCGISHDIANYAEGWILTPPNSEASFEATNRRHQRDGVPFVLDVVKLKHLSPVRKQSRMETDLESKFQSIAEMAQWVDRDWFTYPYHQIALILATVIFDFEDARSFPFLYTTEGGCGGLPPFSNLQTAWSMIHRFHRGKAKNTILGLMDESTQVSVGTMRPNDTFFIRSSHIAQMGDSAWYKYTRLYESLLNGGRSRVEVRELLDEFSEKPIIPEEIRSKGVSIEPDDAYVGVAISDLRNSGELMTELDLKMVLDAARKEQAVSGPVPMREILSSIADEQSRFKANSWKVIGKIGLHLSSRNYPIVSRIQAAMQEVPTGDESLVHAIMAAYYENRSRTHSKFTSFFYTDAIRVYKRSDVEDYLVKSPSGLKLDLGDILSLKRRSDSQFLTPQEGRKTSEVEDWLDSAPLRELLSGPLPPGVGPDDTRIFTSIMKTLEDSCLTESKHPTLILLFSSDRQLALKTQRFAQQRWPHTRWAIAAVETNQYIKICLENCVEVSNAQRRGISFDSWLRTRNKSRRIFFYNYILKKQVPLPDKVMDYLSGIIRKRFGPGHTNIQVEYDFPNLERTLEQTSFDPRRNLVTVRKGRYLARKTLQSANKIHWSGTPIQDISNWIDFEMQTKAVYSLRSSDLDRFRIVISEPQRPDTFRTVSDWQTRVRSPLREETSFF